LDIRSLPRFQQDGDAVVVAGGEFRVAERALSSETKPAWLKETYLRFNFVSGSIFSRLNAAVQL